MNRRTAVLLVLLLLLLVGAGIAVWFLGDAADGPSTPAPEETPAAGGPESRDPSKRAARAAEEGRRPAAIAPAASKEHEGHEGHPTDSSGAEVHGPREVRVRVLLPDGTPAAGADVEVWTDLGAGRFDAWERAERTRGKTDAEGRVKIPFQAWSGYAHAVLRDLVGIAQLEIGGEQGENTVRLGPSREIRGRVVGPDDAPVAGALVHLSWWRESEDQDAGMMDAFEHGALLARTGPDGAFSFAAAPAAAGERSGLEIAAWARGFAMKGQQVERDELGGEILVRLDPASVVVGRCIDERNRPVAGATVVLREAAGEGVGSGVDGRFSLPGVPRSGCEIRILADSLAPLALTIPEITGPQHDLGDVVLRAGGTVTGLFVDLDGKPIAGGHVSITDVASQWTYREVSVGDDGRFVLKHVPPGPQSLQGEEPDTPGDSWSAKRSARLEDVRADGGETKLVLTGALFLHIRFLDAADRTPVKVGSADVEATPLAEEPGGSGSWGWSGGEIDSVRFEMAEAGPYRVSVQVPGYEKAVVEKVDILPDREARIDVLFRKRPQ